jgi:hypothetical protein
MKPVIKQAGVGMIRLSRAAAAAFAFVAAATSAQDVRQTPLPAGHPLLGTWRIDMPNGCFEEYTLRADGVKLSVSAEERNEAVFNISERPSPQGFYRWEDKITKGNGKPDCGGSVTPVGDVSVNFIRLHPSGTKFLLCEEEDMKSCFAEFHLMGRDA